MNGAPIGHPWGCCIDKSSQNYGATARTARPKNCARTISKNGVCRHEVIEVAHGEQALGEGVDSAHVWLVCLVGWVASIVLARRQLGSDGGEYFSSLLEHLARHPDPHLREYGTEGLSNWPMPFAHS